MLIYKNSFPIPKGVKVRRLQIPSIFLIIGQIYPSFQRSLLNIPFLGAWSNKIRCTTKVSFFSIVSGFAAWRSLALRLWIQMLETVKEIRQMEVAGFFFFFSISDTFPVHLVTTFSLEKVPLSLDSIL